MNKKDIRLAADNSYDADWRNGPQPDDILEATIGQLLESGAGEEEEEPLDIGSRTSRTTLNGAGRRSKQEEIEALLERMVFSEKAFLEFPN